MDVVLWGGQVIVADPIFHYGSTDWVEGMVKEYKMESTVRAAGRPRLQ